MRPSLARYVAKVAGATALINFTVNFAVGQARFGRLVRVPVDGKGGIGDDTIFNAFVIACLTFWILFPAARREARSGRVRGGGSSARLLAWIAGHPIVTGVAVGLACSLAIAIPCLLALKHAGFTSLPGARFVWVKSAFATIVSLVAVAAAALPAIAHERDVSDDERWCHDPSAGQPAWPCDYVDKGGLAVTSRAHGCSGTPTWQLLVRGQLDPAHVEIALADTLARYPSLATRVQSLDGAPPHARRYRYAHDPRRDAAALFRAVDLRRQAQPLDAIVREHLDRHTDLFADPPLTLTLLTVDDEHCRLLFRQHHAIADGRAFIELLGDFARFLDDARAGRRPPPEALAPIDRRGELEALALPPLRRLSWTLGGLAFMARAAVRARLRPLARLPQNESNDYTGANGTVHWIVGDDVLDGWNAARKRIGVSLNSLLTAALFAANQRRQRARGGALGRTRGSLVMETRPRAGGFRSFANHIATLDVAADLARDDDVPSLARQLQAQVERQRTRHLPEKRLLAERLFVLALPLSDLQRVVFESRRPAYNFNFSNLIPLAFPTLQGDGFLVEEVHITTPVTPRAGILVTVIRYNGRVVFNFNYKATAATRDDTEQLLAEFQAVLRETAAPSEKSAER